ncbi:MAG TPA: hypothetical protein VJZ77_03840, partial [Blastocatellia bacterium]|nr:hypothetical protein [Blastocatellia bacterium]
WSLRNKCAWCGANCLLAPLRPRTARVNNSRHKVPRALAHYFFKAHKSVAVSATRCADDMNVWIIGVWTGPINNYL